MLFKFQIIFLDSDFSRSLTPNIIFKINHLFKKETESELEIVFVLILYIFIIMSPMQKLKKLFTILKENYGNK